MNSPRRSKPVPNRLNALAAFAPRLRDDLTKFAQFIPLQGTGAPGDEWTIGTGYPTLGVAGAEFVQMAHDSGWILRDFDWSEWQSGFECASLFRNGDALEEADEDQLARMLTLIVRKDRFVEGFLIEAINDGLLTAIAERAEALVRKV